MSSFILTSVGIPIIGSFLVLIARRYRHIVSFSIIGLSLIFLIYFAFSSPLKEAISLKVIGLDFIVDNLSLFMAFCSTLVGILIIYYSFGYMKEKRHLGEYYFFVSIFLGAMVGLIFSGNLLLMYFFWEITTICSWRLIGFYRKSEHLINANKALYLTFLGSCLMLVGIELVYHNYGCLNLYDLHKLAMNKGDNLNTLGFVLLFLGMVAKSAQFPFQVWLPAASVAPTPVTALLHAAVLVKIGVYVFARIFLWTFPIKAQFSEIVLILMIISALISSLSALFENDIKKILAYSTICQISYIFMGLSLNTSIAVKGALLYILVHGIGKAGLFLSAGVVEHETQERDIRKLGGLYKTMPFTAVAFLLCAFSIMGLPPFGGFWAKFFIIFGLIETHHYTIAILMILTAVFTMLYLLRFFNRVFMGRQTHPNNSEGSREMIFTIVVLGIFGLLIGIFIKPNWAILESIINQIQIIGGYYG